MKRLIYSLLICLSMILPLNLVGTKTYELSNIPSSGEREEQIFAAWDTIAESVDGITPKAISTTYNIYDMAKYAGTLPTSADTYSFDLSIDNTGMPGAPAYNGLFDGVTDSWSGEVSLEIGDENGAYNFSHSAGVYTLTDSVSDLKSLSYSATNITLSVAGDFVGTHTFKYRAIVDGKATDFGTLTITIENKGIYYKDNYNGLININYEDLGDYTFNEDFFKNYILCGYDNGTTVDVNELTFGNFVETNPDSGEGYFSCDIDETLYNEVQRVAVWYLKTLTQAGQEIQKILLATTIELKIINIGSITDSLDIYVRGNLVSGTSNANRQVIDLSAGDTISGEIVCSAGVLYSGMEISGNNNGFYLSVRDEQIGGGEDDKDAPVTYRQIFTLGQETVSVGAYNLDLIATDFSTGYSETIYLTISVTTTQVPIITLSSTELSEDKGFDISTLDAMLRGNIERIRLYNGTNLSRIDINDPTKVIISTDLVDSSLAGVYVISYSYTDPETNLTGTASATIEVVNILPTILNVYAYTLEGDSFISNNGKVPLLTKVYFEVLAEDVDSATFRYYGSGARGDLTQDQTDLKKFYYNPTRQDAGVITFSFYVVDEVGPSDFFNFNINFEDITPPTITFSNKIVEVDGSLYLNVTRTEQVFFQNLVSSVGDNSTDGLSFRDIELTATGFTLGTEGRYVFSTLGDYSLTFTLSDASGNTTTETVYIIVANAAPTGQNESYDFSYTETPVVDVKALARDDISGYSIVRSGFITDEEHNALANSAELVDGVLTLNIDPIEVAQGVTKPYVGVVYFYYKVMDADGVLSSEYKLTFNIKDTVAPVVTQTEKEVTFIKGRTYEFVPSGYFVGEDEIDGELSPSAITISKGGNVVSEVEFDEVGEYLIKYTFVDAANNKTEKTVTISIVTGGAPTIELIATSATILVNADFDIYNFFYRITDAEDGNIISNFSSYRESGSLNIDDTSVDVTKSGKYTIKMYFVDSDGNVSDIVSFTLTVEAPAEFPMEIVYYGAGGLGAILLIVLLRVIIVKRRMRI